MWCPCGPAWSGAVLVVCAGFQAMSRFDPPQSIRKTGRPANSASGARAGRTAQRAGEVHEGKVNAINEKYRQSGIALVGKRPTPYQQLGALQAGGTFRARRVGAAGVDFNGVIKGGRHVAFDLKSSSTASLPLTQHGKPTLKTAQADELRTVDELGGVAGVLVRTQSTRKGRAFANWWWVSWDGWQSAVRAAGVSGAKSLGADSLAQHGAPVPMWRGLPDWLAVSQGYVDIQRST